MTTGPAESVPSRTTAIILSAAFSLALHGSVLAAAFVWLDTDPGAVPAPTDAISIELFQTEVLEAVAQAPSLEAAASPASVEVEAGAEHEAAAATSAMEVAKPAPAEEMAAVAPPSPDTAEDAPHGIEVLQGAVETPDAAGSERARPTPTREKAEERPQKPKERARQKTAKLTDPDAVDRSDAKGSTKGGAPSKANKGSAAAKARVSGSTGSAVNYAAMVRARVAARKPGGGGRRGTVVISFGVTSSGGLGYASVARSSGDPGLDRSVLAAVRGASFPAPPPGAGTRFAVPFYFR